MPKPPASRLHSGSWQSRGVGFTGCGPTGTLSNRGCYLVRRARVRAALRAAAERAADPFVCAAFVAAAERSPVLRRAAARLACSDKVARETVLRGSPCRTCFTARDTRG